MQNNYFRYAAAAVLAHAAVMVPHGLAHAGERAYLPLAANSFVGLVIVLAPFVALALLRVDRPRAGALLLFAAMLGALLFGIVYHYMLPGPDHVAHVPPGAWQLPFQITSALLVATEAAGTAVGGWALVASQRAAMQATRGI